MNTADEKRMQALEEKVALVLEELKFLQDKVASIEETENDCHFTQEQYDLYTDLKIEADVLGLSDSATNWLRENRIYKFMDLINLSEIILMKICNDGRMDICNNVKVIIDCFKTSANFRKRIAEYIQEEKEKSLKMINNFWSALDVYADIRKTAEEENIKLNELERWNKRLGIFLFFYQKKFLSGETIILSDDFVDFFEDKHRKIHYYGNCVVQLTHLSELLKSDGFDITLIKEAIVEDLRNVYANISKVSKKYKVYQELINFIDKYEVK